MIKALVSGHVYGLPEIRRDKNEQPFALVKIWLPLTPQSQTRLFVSAIAFVDGPFHEILALSTDDPVSIAGQMKISTWKGTDEKSYPALEMVAHKVLSMPTPINDYE